MTDKIKLEYEDLSAFAWDGLNLGEEEYEFVETKKGTIYKDSMPSTTVCKRLSDNTYWALDWSYYASHYGNGEHQYYNNEIYQVKPVEEIIKYTKWVALDK